MQRLCSHAHRAIHIKMEKTRYNIEAALALCDVKPDKLLVDLLERICVKEKPATVVIAKPVVTFEKKRIRPTKGRRGRPRRVSDDVLENAILSYLGQVRYASTAQIAYNVHGANGRIIACRDKLVKSGQVVPIAGKQIGQPNYQYYARRDSSIMEKIK